MPRHPAFETHHYTHQGTPFHQVSKGVGVAHYTSLVSCAFEVSEGACVPARATQQAIGYDLSVPRVWQAGTSLDLWHACTVRFAGREPVLYMQRVITPRGKPEWAPSSIAGEYKVPREEALVSDIERVTLHPGGRVCVDTKVVLVTQGCYGKIYDRSSMRKRGASILGTGIIDPDYTGSLICWLWNLGHEDIHLEPGQAVAQLVLEPLPCGHQATTLVTPVARANGDAGGFGSTNTNKGYPQGADQGVYNGDTTNLGPEDFGGEDYPSNGPRPLGSDDKRHTLDPLASRVDVASIRLQGLTLTGRPPVPEDFADRMKYPDSAPCTCSHHHGMGRLDCAAKVHTACTCAPHYSHCALHPGSE